MRENDGWDEFLKDIHSFCNKHKVKIPDMDNFYRPVRRDMRFYVKIKNMHRYHVDMFLSVIDRQLQELNDRFDEVNTYLLICMSAFNHVNSFAAFDKASLVKLAQFYPNDFSRLELDHLPCQHQLFITDMHEDERFKQVNSLAELSVMLVSANKHTKHDLVCRLLKLVLVLPVATATVDRVFSIMNYVKNKLRNRMGDLYSNDCLVTFIEREFFMQVKDHDTISRYQAMRDRRVKI
jgi:hypothetical protein